MRLVHNEVAGVQVWRHYSISCQVSSGVSMNHDCQLYLGSLGAATGRRHCKVILYLGDSKLGESTRLHRSEHASFLPCVSPTLIGFSTVDGF